MYMFAFLSFLSLSFLLIKRMEAKYLCHGRGKVNTQFERLLEDGCGQSSS